MSSSRWRRWLRELADEVGADLNLRPGGHFEIRHPSGWFVITPSSPSDERVMKHTRAAVRRQMAFARHAQP